MIETTYPDIDALCRLCLKEHNDAFTIFVDDDAQLSIPMRIIACVSLEAKSSDGLPKKICADCRYQLEKSFLFRQRSQVSDKKLRKHIRLIGQGKKSRVFSKSQEDEDEDELEFEDSIAFITKQDKIRESHTLKWKDKCKEEMNVQLEKRLEAAKAELRAELSVTIREELREEVSSGVRRQLYADVVEETRKEQIAKLIGELDIFLTEKKAGMWEAVETVAVDQKPAEAKQRKRQNSASPKATHTRRIKMEEYHEFDTEMEFESMADGEQETAAVPTKQDVNVNEVEIITNDNIGNQNDGIYIINNATEDDDYEEEKTERYQLESVGKNITSYNIKDNGEIQFSSEKESTQVENVMLLDLDSELNDDLDLTVYEEEVIILPKDKDGSASGQPSAKRSKNEFVVKQMTKGSTETKPRAGRVTDTIKTFRCQMCPIEFATERSWQRHLNTHIKSLKNGRGNGHKCPICELQLSCTSSLKRHMVIHTGMKPHKCEECGQSFVQREVLKRHMDIHTGEKRHQCPHCSTRFAQKTNLQQHIAKVHQNNPRQHKCHLCHRLFNHVSGLSRHLASHAGVMFSCKECGRQYNDRSSIQRHVLNVHNVKDKLVDIYVTEGETIVSDNITI